MNVSLTNPFERILTLLFHSKSELNLETVSERWLQLRKIQGDTTSFIALSILIGLHAPEAADARLILEKAWDALPECLLKGELLTKMKILMIFLLANQKAERLQEEPIALCDIDNFYYYNFEHTSHRYPVPGLK